MCPATPASPPLGPAPRKEPSAGEREGLAPRKEEQHEGAAPREEEPHDNVPLASDNDGWCSDDDVDITRRSRYKRPFDLLVIGVAAILLFPLWATLLLVIPLAIWLEDRGPVFFVQYRAGWRGRRFAILKYRTMRQGAGDYPTTPGDNRLTVVGGLLRKFHLDELPQIVHVLNGDMSLVGPRPEWWSRHVETCREMPSFSSRLRVRPGIAGLAQVRGDYWSSAKEKLRYDNLYIETFGPWLDLKLLGLALVTAARHWFKPPAPRQTPAQRCVVGAVPTSTPQMDKPP